MKRGFDFMISLAGLIMLSPLFMVLGVVIWAEDQGPVFFRQTRIGKGGKTFRLFKFRSMRPPRTKSEGSFIPGDISRVTSVGRFIRKTKLDELPQLINVLKGDMSLVGPRPEVERWVAAFPERWKIVHSVRPGITDIASLAFRNEESILAASDNPENLYRNVILPKKLDYCEKYVMHHSFAGDLLILFKTLIPTHISEMNPETTHPSHTPET
jgi:lipopolysaccharide/colanic/teichoic acid biosynthesis glycosyltransferase